MAAKPIYIGRDEPDMTRRMSVLYENVVHHDTFPVSKLIRLSELKRRENFSEYASCLKELIEALRSPSARLQKQPLFQWSEWGLESCCFRFELHRALSRMHDKYAEVHAEEHAEVPQHTDESRMRALQASLELVKNLSQWTAQHTELKRFPLMHINYLLSLVATNKALVFKKRYERLYSEEWQHGGVHSTMQKARECIREACRFATSAALLWKTSAQETCCALTPLERECRIAYFSMSSLCGSTFQERLDYASASAEHDKKCAEVMELNDRLYFLTPNPVEAPEHAGVQDILKLTI